MDVAKDLSLIRNAIVSRPASVSAPCEPDASGLRAEILALEIERALGQDSHSPVPTASSTRPGPGATTEYPKVVGPDNATSYDE